MLGTVPTLLVFRKSVTTKSAQPRAHPHASGHPCPCPDQTEERLKTSMSKALASLVHFVFLLLSVTARNICHSIPLCTLPRCQSHHSNHLPRAIPDPNPLTPPLPRRHQDRAGCRLSYADSSIFTCLNVSLISRLKTHGMHREHYTSQNPTHDQANMVDPCPMVFIQFAYLSRF